MRGWGKDIGVGGGAARQVRRRDGAVRRQCREDADDVLSDSSEEKASREGVRCCGHDCCTPEHVVAIFVSVFFVMPAKCTLTREAPGGLER